MQELRDLFGALFEIEEISIQEIPARTTSHLAIKALMTKRDNSA